MRSNRDALETTRLADRLDESHQFHVVNQRRIFIISRKLAGFTDDFVDFLTSHLISQSRQSMTEALDVNKSTLLPIVKDTKSSLNLFIRLLNLLALKDKVLEGLKIDLACILTISLSLKRLDLLVRHSNAQRPQCRTQLVRLEYTFALSIQQIENLLGIVWFECLSLLRILSPPHTHSHLPYRFL